ncbi:MAG TPA: hypothetical protein VFG42_26125 [Baekduia sp.]|nr:hypothetical protein [Baekduia sp.]
MFGFSVSIPNVPIGFRVRTEGDAGLTAQLTGINQPARIFAQSMTLWGIPADASHDGQRGGCLLTNTTDDGDPSTPLPDTRCPVAVPRVPLLRNPTSCGAELRTTLDVSSWTDPDTYVRATATAPAITGCDAVPATCPDASKIGSVAIDTPLLAKPLAGTIYLGGSPSPRHYEIFAVAEGSGVRLKLPGTSRPI